MKVRLVALTCAASIIACSGESASREYGANDPQALAPSDSVILGETDAIFIGSPAHLTAGPGSTILVSDALNSVVHQFGLDGRYIETIGRRGSGPGEMGRPVASVVAGDSLLIVSDWMEGRANLFSLPGGEFIESVPLESFPFSMAVLRDTVLMGVTNVTRLTGLARWGLESSEGIDYFGTVPAEYVASQALLYSHPYTTMTLMGDTVLYGFSGHGGLFLANLKGEVFDTIMVPAVRRRGVPTNIVQRFANPALSDAEIAGMVSALVSLHRLRDGRIAVVHQDVNIEQGSMSAATFLSFLSPDLRHVCPDIPLQYGHDRRPVVTFAGDTLLTLETKLRNGERAENVLLSYDLRGTDCRWHTLQ